MSDYQFCAVIVEVGSIVAAFAVRVDDVLDGFELVGVGGLRGEARVDLVGTGEVRASRDVAGELDQVVVRRGKM